MTGEASDTGELAFWWLGTGGKGKTCRQEQAALR